MNRTGMLAAVVVMLGSSPTFGQFGGAGGMGGGMGGMGGGMGGQGMTAGMMGQGGRVAGASVIEVRRSAQVEMEGGQRLSGKIDLRSIVVDGDLGRYMIAPYKIKVIRFLKPVDGVNPVNGPEGDNNNGAGGGNEAVVVQEAILAHPAVRRVGRVGVAIGGFQMQAPTRGKVITTTDNEIIGTIHIPTEFRLELEFGSLVLAPDKLRSITFTEESRENNPRKGAAKAPGAPHDLGHLAPGREASPPRYFRHGSSIFVISPVGDRVTLYSLETAKSESLEFSASHDSPLGITPILDQNLVALMLAGPKIARIAVADIARGTWHAQELRKPIDGRAVPIVASGVVVYNLGPDVYAYGAEAERWDVVELPDGIRAAPTVAPGTATIETDGHIYTFTSKSGKWNHVDVRAILDAGANEKK